MPGLPEFRRNTLAAKGRAGESALKGRQGVAREPIDAYIVSLNHTIPMKEEAPLSRKEMIRLLNEDLAREYQAIIAYVVYSQTIKGAKYQHIAGELEKHASEELSHAILLEIFTEAGVGTEVVAGDQAASAQEGPARRGPT